MEIEESQTCCHLDWVSKDEQEFGKSNSLGKVDHMYKGKEDQKSNDMLLFVAGIFPFKGWEKRVSGT